MSLFPDATTLGAFAMVAVAASSAAQLGRGLHLPLISGYILAGAIAGPYVLGLLTHEQVHSMKLLINSDAMGFIGFSAGTKFLLTELHGSVKPVRQSKSARENQIIPWV
jgi:NhaP-type Na+/H+ or K+/H+ antiporter